MAILSLNNDQFTFEVDLAPLKEELADKIRELVEGTGNGGGFKEDILRGIVKEACNIAMKTIGLQKQDRNDDPIEIMANYLIELGFSHIEENGLKLVGNKLDQVLSEVAPADAPAVETAPTQTAGTSAADAADPAAVAPTPAPAEAPAEAPATASMMAPETLEAVTTPASALAPETAPASEAVSPDVNNG